MIEERETDKKHYVGDKKSDGNVYCVALDYIFLPDKKELQVRCFCFSDFPADDDEQRVGYNLLPLSTWQKMLTWKERIIE